jgi:CheY-like chemotaxis protein/signal transduction histidine kinase
MATYRPVLQSIARMIGTDRRAAVLATEFGEVLLANLPARRLGLAGEALGTALASADLNWPDLCTRAQRAGSVRIKLRFGECDVEGELVHLPLGQAESFLLRLSETDQEATWLRNRARAATLMRVAHDLRTPIQSLLVAAETALDALEGGQTGDARTIQRLQLQRAAALALDHISNVLGVIRGEQGLSGLRPDEDFCISSEMRGLLAMVTPIAEARGATISLSMTPSEDIWVHGPVRFARALCQNMIDNSVKYGGKEISVALRCRPLSPILDGMTAPVTAPDGGVTTIESHSAASAHGMAGAPNDLQEPTPHVIGAEPAYAICIEVCDQGGGMPDAQKERLNKALDQAMEGREQVSRAGGTADRASSGLDVLAHALRQLGGRLEIRDRGMDGELLPEDAARSPGEVLGASLRATFTLKRGLARDYLNASGGDMIAPPKGAPSLKDVGILVVEDSPSSRDWLVQMLRSAGARVQGVENGIEALEILHSDKAAQIDVMLSDMTLPFISGVELVRRITRAQTDGTLAWRGKMLGLTAHVDHRLTDACVRAGMQRVLEKPILPATLCHSILDALTADAAHVPPATAADAQPVADVTVPQDAGTSAAKDEPRKPAKAAKRTSVRRANSLTLIGKGGQGDEEYQVLAQNVVSELVEHLGLVGSERFMRRAQIEAQSVLADIAREGIVADTGRLLHAATGACGLAGLKRLERSLRALELALNEPDVDLAPLIWGVEIALTDTARATEALTATHNVSDR